MKANSEVYREYFDFRGKVLILLEHEEQIKSCVEWLNEIKGKKQVIALSPFAMYELDKQNVPRTHLDDGKSGVRVAEAVKMIIQNKDKEGANPNVFR